MTPLPGECVSAINTVFKLVEFGLALKAVSEENKLFLSLINRVRADRDEALRERREKLEALRATPEKKAWIDKAILDIEEALVAIGSLIESARVDREKGRSITLKHRFEWVLANHQTFIGHQLHLSTCHQSLLSTITTMHFYPASPPILAPPEYTFHDEQAGVTLADMDTFKSPFARRPKLEWQDKTEPMISIQLFESPSLRTPSAATEPFPFAPYPPTHHMQGQDLSHLTSCRIENPMQIPDMPLVMPEPEFYMLDRAPLRMTVSNPHPERMDRLPEPLQPYRLKNGSSECIDGLLTVNDVLPRSPSPDEAWRNRMRARFRPVP